MNYNYERRCDKCNPRPKVNEKGEALALTCDHKLCGVFICIEKYKGVNNE